MAKKKASKKKAQSKARKKTTKRKTASRRRGASSALPRRIYAIASPLSTGGISIFSDVDIDASNVAAFTSDDALIERAVHLLTDAGFDVLQVTPMMINICGTATQYKSAFGAELFTHEREVIKSGGKKENATFIDCKGAERHGLISMEGTRFEEILEGVVIEEPCYIMSEEKIPPTTDYWHLDVPGDVSVGCNADKAHRGGRTGKNVVVAMTDTGWEEHAFFTSRGYRVDPTILGPGASLPTVDEVGHGTGESANIFATAPDATLKPVKISFANATAGFNAAVALNPDIITNSWGSGASGTTLSPAQQALGAAVANAVAAGIVVVFSAGNGGKWGFPAQHPDVIAVGGVHMKENGDLEASSYTSGFMSNVYPGRRVPDVSGLVGMAPGNAKYIMLPVPEGCQIDVGNSGGSHPFGDETPSNDGWAAFSGTSAAAPQVAGVCALMRQANSSLSPTAIRKLLRDTAIDVTTGTNANGNSATTGPDTATGHGLVNAHKAVLFSALQIAVPPKWPPYTPPLVPPKPPYTLPIKWPIKWPLKVPLPPVPPKVPFKPIVPLDPVVPLQPPLHPIFENPGVGEVISPISRLTPEDLRLISEILLAADM